MPATPNHPTNTPDATTICACDSIVPDTYIPKARDACVGDTNYTHELRSYCVMHYPNQDKADAFRNAFIKKILAGDYNYCGVYFPPGTGFLQFKKPNDKQFCFNTDADFSYATFSSKAYFQEVMFSGEANFTCAKFNDVAHFPFATFSSLVYFNSAIFKGSADFRFTTFSGWGSFAGTQFKKNANFALAQFKDYVRFKRGAEEMFGKEASLTFDSLQIEKPERLSFHSVNLRPHWFINTDPHKFEFIDVRWDNDLVKEREARKSDRLLSIAYRQLAVNAEENSRYEDAMDFRKKSMETSLFSLQEKWREDWLKKRWGSYSIETFSWWWEYGTIRKLFSLTWWYRTLSSYGEGPTRAAIVLLLILCLSCVPYWFTDFASSKDITQNKTGKPIPVMLAPEENKAKQFLATLVYSLETASLQKPEPRPVTTMARLFVGLETILAPLQAALLALAIRRKYMR